MVIFSEAASGYEFREENFTVLLSGPKSSQDFSLLGCSCDIISMMQDEVWELLGP